jgi:filamentous hemagglutinin family protein
MNLLPCLNLRTLLLTLGSSILTQWYIPAMAQSVTPDATLANPSIVTQSGGLYEITGGTTRTTNLFHSFDQFSLNTGETAYFNNNASITNIFARVTGSDPSTIDGVLQANGTANLFLINPNGIIFQSNAQLNLGGSFIASSADSIRFQAPDEFSATDPQDVPLSIDVPLGLQFGFSGTQGIQVAANLQVAPGASLVLAGHPTWDSPGVVVTGSLTAPQGRIAIASVGPAFLSLSNDATGWQLGETSNLRDVVVGVEDLSARYTDVLSRNLNISIVNDEDESPEPIPSEPLPEPEPEPEPDLGSELEPDVDVGLDADPTPDSDQPISETPGQTPDEPDQPSNPLPDGSPSSRFAPLLELYGQSYGRPENSDDEAVQEFLAIPQLTSQETNPVMPQCEAGGGNEFVISGRGGLPANPAYPLQGETVWQDMRLTELPSSNSSSHLTTNSTTHSTRVAATTELPTTDSTTLPPVIEAQGWVRDAEGQIHLVGPSAFAASPELAPLSSEAPFEHPFEYSSAGICAASLGTAGE